MVDGGIDWFNVGSGLGILASLAKGYMASKRADKAEAHAAAIESDRETTKLDRDRKIQELETRQAVMDAKCKEMEARLQEGNGHFAKLEQEMKESNKAMQTELAKNNELLNRLVGALQNSGLRITTMEPRDSRLEL